MEPMIEGSDGPISKWTAVIYCVIVDVAVNEQNLFNAYTDEEIENFRCIFEMFDKDKSGYIDVSDLQTIMKSLGRDPSEAFEMIKGLDINQDGKLSFEEFLQIMRHLENRLV